jgi:hypothetical protein
VLHRFEEWYRWPLDTKRRKKKKEGEAQEETKERKSKTAQIAIEVINRKKKKEILNTPSNSGKQPLIFSQKGGKKKGLCLYENLTYSFYLPNSMCVCALCVYVEMMQSHALLDIHPCTHFWCVFVLLTDNTW